MLCDRETTEKVSILIPVFNLNLNGKHILHLAAFPPAASDGRAKVMGPGHSAGEVSSLPGPGSGQERRTGSQ